MLTKQQMLRIAMLYDSQGACFWGTTQIIPQENRVLTLTLDHTQEEALGLAR